LARHRLAYILAIRLALTFAAAMLAYAGFERIRDPESSLVTLGGAHAAHVVAALEWLAPAKAAGASAARPWRPPSVAAAARSRPGSG
jgi:uncharacterized Zn finger protein